MSYSTTRTTAMMMLLSSVVLLVRGEQTPCIFCTRGMITEPEKSVNITGYEFIETCGTLDLLLPQFLTEDDPQCQQVQSISTLCGCPPPDNSCSFCPDGSRIALPDKEVPWFAGAFGGIVPTCDMMEAYSASLAADDGTCSLLQRISSHCGCAPLPNACSYCNGEPLQEQYYNKKVPFLTNEAFGVVGTCELYWVTQYQTPNTAYETCELSFFATTYCGCNDGLLPYYSTSTERQQKFMAWLPRCVGIVSLIASCLVSHHILKSPKKRVGVYQQFILLIVVFDVITSLVWIVGPAAVNEINGIAGIPWGIYGAHGNNATCKTSGFFFQLGVTSIFLTLSLTVFYYLMIVRGVKESRLRQLRPWLFVPPLVIGFALAFAAVPYVNIAWTVCQPRVTPVKDNPFKIIFLLLLPVGLSTVSILILLFVIYWKVRNQMRRGSRWSASSHLAGSASSQEKTSAQLTTTNTRSEAPKRERSSQERLECEVFYQCVSYAAAYGLTWPMLLWAQVQGENMDYPMWFWIIVCSVAPMQGLSNSLCYFRPYMSRSCGRRSRNAGTAAARRNGSAAPPPEDPNNANSRFVTPKGLKGKMSKFVRASNHPNADSDHEAVDPTVQLANMAPESPNKEEYLETHSGEEPEFDQRFS